MNQSVARGFGAREGLMKQAGMSLKDLQLERTALAEGEIVENHQQAVGGITCGPVVHI